jgi:hypothetical protein
MLGWANMTFRLWFLCELYIGVQFMTILAFFKVKPKVSCSLYCRSTLIMKDLRCLRLETERQEGLDLHKVQGTAV